MKKESNLFLKELKILTDHVDIISSVIILKDGRIASGSRDSTIHIYDPFNEYNLDIIIKTKNNRGVLSILELNSKKILSCAWDNSIDIFIISKDSYYCEYTMINCHTKLIWKVIEDYYFSKIITCSADKTIKIWTNSYPYSLVKELNGHKHCVLSIIELKKNIGCNKILASISLDDTIKFWDLKYYQCISTITEIKTIYSSNSIFEFNDFVLVGEYNSLCLISTKDFCIAKRINYDLGSINSFTLINNSTVLCGTDMYILCLRFNEDKIDNLFCQKFEDCGSICTINNLNPYKIVFSSGKKLYICKYSIT